MDINQELAIDLLAINAVQIRPDNYFTWTSGIKSPIYCDNRLTMSYPTIRKKITNAFIGEIKKMDEMPEVISGCATAGIPHAAWLADQLNLPMVYVRSKPKGHGKGNQIEGEFEKGKKVLVIEDLISTGGSSIEAAKVLQEEGAIVLGVLAIFTYGLSKAEQNFSREDLTCNTITNFDDVLHHLWEEGKLDEGERKNLLQWRVDM